MAEIELSALNGQCLRLPHPLSHGKCGVTSRRVAKRIATRVAHQLTGGHFTTEDARIKLTRVYPKL